MPFLVRNEYTQEWQNGEVIVVDEFEAYITLQFNDAHETFTWGLPDAPLPTFIKPLRG